MDNNSTFALFKFTTLQLTLPVTNIYSHSQQLGFCYKKTTVTETFNLFEKEAVLKIWVILNSENTFFKTTLLPNKMNIFFAKKNAVIGLPQLVDSLASRCFRGFSEKKRLNAHGFAREFVWSGTIYRPGKSLRRRGKSSSLHSKKNFLLGGCGFLVSTS